MRDKFVYILNIIVGISAGVLLGQSVGTKTAFAILLLCAVLALFFSYMYHKE